MKSTLKVTTPSDTEIRMTRVFDAPRRLVWEAWTRPELIRRWLTGLPGWTMTVCEYDARVGGTYRYVWRKAAATPVTDGCPDMVEMGMGGTILEVAAPQRLVATERFDQAWYDGEAVVTLLLTESDGRTTLEELVRYQSKAVRDAVLKTPMESGVAFSYDQLEALLASLPAGAEAPVSAA